MVCRAFKKPNPSHKQGFEAWNNAYYLRDSTYRPPTYPSPSNIMQTYDPINQGTNFHQPPALTSGQNPYENQIVELPKLDSPSISTSFVTSDNVFEHSMVASDDIEDDKGSFGNQYSDWKSFDKFLGSQVFGESSSSYGYTNMTNNDDQLVAQGHFNSVLECFPHDL